jgi:hypothetical protein
MSSIDELLDMLAQSQRGEAAGRGRAQAQGGAQSGEPRSSDNDGGSEGGEAAEDDTAGIWRPDISVRPGMNRVGGQARILFYRTACAGAS